MGPCNQQPLAQRSYLVRVHSRHTCLCSLATIVDSSGSAHFFPACVPSDWNAILSPPLQDCPASPPCSFRMSRQGVWDCNSGAATQFRGEASPLNREKGMGTHKESADVLREKHCGL